MQSKPDSVVILGSTYQILYEDNPANVDANKRESLWGQVDFWTQTIRIYDNHVQDGHFLQLLLHEMLHVIANDLHLVLTAEEFHDHIDRLALALADTFLRNGWITVDKEKE